MLDRVADTLPLDVGYYREGKTKFIYSELYKSSPFKVTGGIKDENIYTIPIYLKIINDRKFYISFTVAGKDYEYSSDTGRILSSPFFSISVSFPKEINPEDISGLYYFKFLTRDEVFSDIANKLAVSPIDPTTKNILLSFKDRNPERARDI